MPRDLSAKEVLDRRVKHAKKMLKQSEQEKGVKGAKKMVELYGMIPDSVIEPQSKVLQVLTGEIKALIIGYAFLGLAEWAEAATKGAPNAQNKDQIMKACIERGLHNLIKDGLFDPANCTDVSAFKGPTIIQ